MASAGSAVHRIQAAPPDDVTTVERALLGALLREPHLMARVKTMVSAEHFSTPIGERVFLALEERAQAVGAAPLAWIADRLGVYEWDEPGGADLFLRDLAASSAPDVPLEHMAQLISGSAERRGRAGSLYREDIAEWALRQSDMLKSLSLRPDLAEMVDWANVIEEVRSVGRSEVGGVARRIELVFVHAMKIISSPDPRPAQGWRREIDLHLNVLASNFAPSMRRLLTIDRLWANAAREAARDLDEYGERLSRKLPQTSPLTLDDLLSHDADTLVRRLADGLDRATCPLE